LELAMVRVASRCRASTTEVGELAYEAVSVPMTMRALARPVSGA
jgi:hypothetical protein